MVFEIPRHFSEKQQRPVWSTFHDRWWRDVSDPYIQYQSQEWAGMCRRFLRKAALRHISHDSSGLSHFPTNISEYQQVLNQFFSDRHLNQVLDHLLHEGFFVEPTMYQFAQGLQTKIEAQYPGVHTVLLGSSAHGTAVLKTAFAVPPHDFDWGIVHDGDLNAADLVAIHTLGKEYIAEHAAKPPYNFPDTFTSCGVAQPERLHAKSAHSPDQILKMLYNPDGSLAPDIVFTQLSLYFYPSVPPEYNQQHQARFLAALRELASQNYDHWQQVTQFLIHDLTGKNLAEKHFEAIVEKVTHHQTPDTPTSQKDLSLTKLAQKIIEQRPKVTKRRLIQSILETGRITN